MERQSFETLDLGDLEEVADESGARRLPSPPRGLWSDVPPPLPRPVRPVRPVPAPPPPLPRAAAEEPLEPLVEELHDEVIDDHADLAALVEELSEPEERVDFDHLVEDLSARPAPRPAAHGGFPLDASRLPAPTPAPAPSRRGVAPLAALGIGLAALALGATWLLARSPEQAAPAPTAAPAPIELEPIVIAAAPELAPEPAAAEAAPASIEPEREAPPPHAPARAARPRVQETGVADADEAPARRVRVAASELPESPAREDVLAAMTRVTPAVEACVSEADRGQRARVRFSFASDGRAVHALVEGVGGATASCIARAARTVRVPAFARERFVIEYPFQL